MYRNSTAMQMRSCQSKKKNLFIKYQKEEEIHLF